MELQLVMLYSISIKYKWKYDIIYTMGVCGCIKWFNDTIKIFSISNDVQFNDLVVSGDLTVQGTAVTLNTTNLEVEDKLLSVANFLLHQLVGLGRWRWITYKFMIQMGSFTWDNGNSRIHINKNTFFSGSVQE